jgi:hypothetical protein
MPKIDATQKSWPRELEAQLDHKLSTDDKKLINELVQRAQITDFTEIGSGRPVQPHDLKHEAKTTYHELEKKHGKDSLWAREWPLDPTDKHSETVLVVARESKKGNLSVRFFESNGRPLEGENGEPIAPYPIKIGSMYDGQD